ncbi:uncharacterized protein LOC111900529 [Lactuca sativa]|uniref:uncharacterized protein LOC111900529 n=1 Tax=Lactuca sativa TaxID=4236 RepID=UPI000CD91115|nr:uncharacterized protein LOC111900529 [Lactuca sativa]
MKHIGDIPNSQHYNVVRFCDTLMNQSVHIDKEMQKKFANRIEKNRLRGIYFRGHDEKIDSKNCANFIDLIKYTTSYNEEVAVEDNYDSKYCIIVDEASDESKKEQMSIVLRYVDKKVTYKNDFLILSVSKIHHLPLCILLYMKLLLLTSLLLRIVMDRGMMELTTCVVNDRDYKHYSLSIIHVLIIYIVWLIGLVATAGEVSFVHEHFPKLSFIVNVVDASCKRQYEIQAAQAAVSGEINTGKGANQIGTLKCVGDTHWSSHFTFISSLLRMFNPTCTVLENIKNRL